MRFAFSDDQLLLQSTVRDFLKKECTPDVVRALWATEIDHDATLWSKLAELGVCGALVPDAQGGMGLDERDLVLLLEETGRAALPAPVVATAAVGAPLLRDANVAALGDAWLPRVAAGDAILDYVKAQNLAATGLTVTFDGASSTVSVFGVAPDQSTKEKIALCCGNVAGVGKVNEMMSVSVSEPPAQYYTVVSGDTLSKISKQYYGDANQYMKIFEANKPMLTHPDKIYPGQMLRIPPV